MELSRVERLDLRAQVRKVRLCIERAAHRTREQLRRLERAAPPVHVLPQPSAQRAELATFELLVEVGQIGCCALPKLYGDDIPERVGGEIAEVGVRPVDVLQDPVNGVRRLDAEVLPKLRVERLR